MLTRRGILGTLAGLVAAPAIIKVADLMPVKSSLVVPSQQWVYHVDTDHWTLHENHGLRRGDWITLVEGPAQEPREFIVTGVERGNTYLTVNQVTREAVRLFKNSNKFLDYMNRQYAETLARDPALLFDEPVSPVQAAALGAAAVVACNPSISRRSLFFGGVREERSVASPGPSSSDLSRRIINQETVA